MKLVFVVLMEHGLFFMIWSYPKAKHHPTPQSPVTGTGRHWTITCDRGHTVPHAMPRHATPRHATHGHRDAQSVVGPDGWPLLPGLSLLCDSGNSQ